MKSYSVIERGSRGEVEGIEILESEKDIKGFCTELYENKVKELKEGLDKEELGDLEECLEKWGGISDLENGGLEILIFEELSFEVYRIV